METTIMENQMEKQMENEMETGIIKTDKNKLCKAPSTTYMTVVTGAITRQTALAERCKAG